MPTDDPSFARLHFDDAVAMFWHAVDAAGRGTALIDGDRQLTYEQYGRAVAALAQHLERLKVAGERVAILVPNSIESNVAVFAALNAGAQVVMLNPAYTEDELAPLMSAAAPRAVLVLAGSDAVARQAAAVQGVADVVALGEGELALDALLAASAPRPRPAIGPESPATLMFTGGTTGRPKGVFRSNRMLVDHVAGMNTAWPTRLDEEVWLNVAPISHVWGFQMGLMNPVYGRSALVIVPRYKPDTVLDALQRHRVTVFSGGPAAIYVGLLATPSFAKADLSALRLCPGGGSPFLLETLKAWEEAVGVPILEAFGMTEGGPITANPTDGTHRFGTVGRPLPGVELQIVDLEAPERPLAIGEAGEIRVRGASVSSRYWGEASGHPDGWLLTGDVGVLDADGYLRLVDRKKDMLIVGGFNVYPREIEEVLARHPAIIESAVIGTPDERKGEVPIAFVVVRAAGATAEELAAYCAGKLVGYKLPKRVILVDALPKTAANKTDKKVLARLVGEARAAAPGEPE